MPFVGEVLPLSLQLLDGATNKFVRATIFEKPSNATFGVFAVPHIGLGKYTLSTVLMPAGVDYLDVTYEVYNDSLFTTLSDDHLSGTEVFRLEIPDSVFIEKLDQILEKILKGGELVAQLDGRELTGLLDAMELCGKLNDTELVARLSLDEELAARLIPVKELEGEIEC